MNELKAKIRDDMLSEQREILIETCEKLGAGSVALLIGWHEEDMAQGLPGALWTDEQGPILPMQFGKIRMMIRQTMQFAEYLTTVAQTHLFETSTEILDTQRLLEDTQKKMAILQEELTLRTIDNAEEKISEGKGSKRENGSLSSGNT